MTKTYALVLLSLFIYSCNDSVKEYYKNNTLKAEYFLDSEKQYHGTYLEYFQNGNLQSKKNYEHGVYNGTQESYDSTGFKDYESYFENDKITGYKHFNKAGKVIYSFTYLDTLHLPKIEDFKIRFSNSKTDTLVLGDTTLIDVQCNLISKNNLRSLIISSGNTLYHWEKDSFIISYLPKYEGDAFMAINIKINDSIEKIVGHKNFFIRKN